ncbi:MAG TPA: MarR family transcriptional regulator [Candidatus Paceibacterota bacterium]|nr:MarR family transcriptional regulator [Candidatus Paceibacterota bacterium]
MSSGHYAGQTLEDLILALRRTLSEHLKQSSVQSDLSLMQFEVIIFLQSVKEATMEEIARHFRIKAPSATNHISELEKKGMIRRTSRPGDRRVVCVSLTTKAQNKIHTIRQEKRALYQKFFSKLSPQDVEELKRILTKLLT